VKEKKPRKTKSDKVIRFTISLPQSLLNELDSKTVGKGYSSRSEFVRDLIREQMIESKWDSRNARVVGVLILIYDHHQRDLGYRLTEAQHQKNLNVLCSTHVHLDHHNCLETIFIHGTPDDIERITTEIGGLRGVKFSKLTKTAQVRED
jgi:CopG family transcriptional regulator, nickel-responsive regulator